MLRLILVIFVGGIVGFYSSLKNYGIKDKEVDLLKLKKRILFLESMNSYLFCTLALASLLIAGANLGEVDKYILLSVELISFFGFTYGNVYLYFSKDVMVMIENKKLENEEKVSISELHK